MTQNKDLNLLEKIVFIIVLLIGLLVRDRHIYVILPFLIYLLRNKVQNKENISKIFYYMGLIGAGYTVLGYSFEGFITNRGIFLMVISLIYNYFYKKENIKIPYKPVIYIYCIIFILGIIWNLLSPGGMEGIGRFISVNKRFMSIILFFNIINTEKKFNNLKNIFILGGVITGVYCLGNYGRIMINSKNILDYRTMGFTNYAYTSGAFMMCGLLIFGMLWNKFNIKNKVDWLYGLGLLVILGGLFTTKTRAAILGFIIGSIIVIIMNFNLKKLIILLFLGGIVGISCPQNIKKSGLTRITQITLKSNSKNVNTVSDNLRRVMWKGSIYAWENNKIFGTGSRGTGKWVQEYADKNVDKNGYLEPGVTRKMFTFREAHSIYLNFLAELGILSIGYLILFFIILPLLVLKIFKKKKNKYIGEFTGATGALYGYLAYGVVWSIWGYFGNIQEIFQYMIFILIYINNKEKY